MESDGNGLSLDVLPSGKTSWLYRYRLNGAYGKVTLGRYPDLSLKAARAKRNELATMVAEADLRPRRRDTSRLVVIPQCNPLATASTASK